MVPTTNIDIFDAINQVYHGDMGYSNGILGIS
jgi:hypothetical protein